VQGEREDAKGAVVVTLFVGVVVKGYMKLKSEKGEEKKEPNTSLPVASHQFPHFEERILTPRFFPVKGRERRRERGRGYPLPGGKGALRGIPARPCEKLFRLFS